MNTNPPLSVSFLILIIYLGFGRAYTIINKKKTITTQALGLGGDSQMVLVPQTNKLNRRFAKPAAPAVNFLDTHQREHEGVDMHFFNSNAPYTKEVNFKIVKHLANYKIVLHSITVTDPAAVKWMVIEYDGQILHVDTSKPTAGKTKEERIFTGPFILYGFDWPKGGPAAPATEEKEGPLGSAQYGAKENLKIRVQMEGGGNFFFPKSGKKIVVEIPEEKVKTVGPKKKEDLGHKIEVEIEVSKLADGKPIKKDVTADFTELVGKNDIKQLAEIITKAHKARVEKYHYLMVRGLATNTPGYMDIMTEALKELKVEHSLSAINSFGTVAENVKKISEEITKISAKKKVILIGHSKGTVDSASLPKDIQKHVAGFLSLQGPLFGSPAEDIIKTTITPLIMPLVTKFFDFKGSAGAITDISIDKMIARPIFDTATIPTIVLVNYLPDDKPWWQNPVRSILNDFNDALIRLTGMLSDGMVPMYSAILSGAYMVRSCGIDHAAPGAWQPRPNPDGGQITLAAIKILFDEETKL